MADTLVILGGVVFDGYAIPEKIPFGGKQNLKIHEMIGGQRVVDSLGASPDAIKFKGKFRGPGAMANAQALDAMRIAGSPVSLTWLGLNYLVVIQDFGAETEKFYEVPYTVTCAVVQDPQQIVGAALSSLTALVGGDMTAALAIPEAAALPSVAALGAGVAAQYSLDGAANSVIVPLQAGVASATTAIQAAAATSDAALAGGLSAASLLAQATASQSEYDLLNANALVTRIGINLSTGAF